MYGDERGILPEGGLRMLGDLRYPCYTLSPWQRNTV